MIKAVQKLLVFVGKPFYWALEVLIIAALYAVILLKKIILKLAPKPKKPRYLKLKKIKIIKKIKAKKKGKIFRLPDLITPIKIAVLTLRLKILKILVRLKKLLSKTKTKTKPSFKKLLVRKPKFTLPILMAIAACLLFYFLVLYKLPSPRDLGSRKIDVSTKIFDRNGVLLYTIYKDQNRSLISLKDVPEHVRLATLAAEDAEFYSHPGFSLKGIGRAIIKNIREGKLSGGSTITQQLVKNALLTPEKTVIRKIKEIILAMQVERIFSKDQILEMYLNEISYGGTTYGINEAAQEFFGKKVKDLSLAEAAYLAGLTKSPTKLSFYGSRPELGLARKNEVLHLMKINGYITADQEKIAANEELNIRLKKTDIKAPHFVMYIREILAEKYGEETAEKGGLNVVTSLDYQIQSLAEKTVKEEILKLKNLKVGNGAALVLNPQTGEILAMVGSYDYFDEKIGKFNVTLANRQPGSSIKVINYAYALAHGYTPASIIDDSPVSFAVPNQPLYAPVNYDGNYRGKITLRSALAESRNIPAVKILASYGVAKMIELGQQMGIKTWDAPDRFGLSLTLGGGEVKLLELSQVYATIANFGEKPEIKPILKITDQKGKIIFESENKKEKILDPRVAFLLIDILKDNSARAPAFGLNSYLNVKNHPEVAVKTGTSNNLKDNLTVGFNQNYLVAVWVGNNDSTPMSRIASGVTGASPIWNKIMTAILTDAPAQKWPIPEGIVTLKDCGGRTEYFLKESKFRYNCSVPLSPQPTSPSQILNGAATTNR